MTVWYLIVTLWSNDPAAVPAGFQSGPYYTEKACQDAGGALAIGMKAGSPKALPSMRGVCVKSGERGTGA